MAKKNIECNIPPRIFLVYKPRGLHSGDVLKHFKYNLPRGYGKIGHLGTLDPFAEGLLLIAVAQAARLSFLFEDLLTKTYLARGVFNLESTTGDSDGIITKSISSVSIKPDEFIKQSLSLVGTYYQSPPHFSAAKHEGKALYKYAREGVLIDKPPVKRVIYGLSEFDFIENDRCFFKAEVSSGTYIRTLFEDMAKLTKTVGHLDYLQRLKIGEITCENSLRNDKWPKRGEEFDLIENSICPSVFFNFDRLVADDALLGRIENGQRIAFSDVELADKTEGNYLWVFSKEQKIRGLLQVNEGILRPRVIFPKIIENI